MIRQRRHDTGSESHWREAPGYRRINRAMSTYEYDSESSSEIHLLKDVYAYSDVALVH
jgi:hypothetical protein